MLPYEMLWNALLETYFKYISRLVIRNMNHFYLPEQRGLLSFFNVVVSTELSLFTSELDHTHTEKSQEAWFKLKHVLFNKESKLVI